MRTHLLLLLCCACSLPACDVFDFTMTQPIPEQMIIGSPISMARNAAAQVPIDFNLNEQILAQDTGPINAITLEAIEFDITKTDEPPGDTDDWSFVTSVELAIESTKVGTTLPKLNIASAVGAVGETRLVFDVDNTGNIEPYIGEGAEIAASGTGTLPPDAVSYDGLVTLTIHPL